MVISKRREAGVAVGPLTDPDRPRGHADLEPLTFDGLAGFAEDNHAEAFRVFRRSCNALLAHRRPLRAAAPPSAALLSICRHALDIGGCDGFGARRFFETHFRPQRIVTNATSGAAQGFLTGYYEPLVEGSLTPCRGFPAPVLAWPKGYVRQRMGAGERSYMPSRAEIEALARDGRFEPIVWLRDPAEVFFVQVQGSARVRLTDGTSVRLVYAGRNGHPYTSIGRILVESGEITPGDMSLARLKAWIRDHGQVAGEAGAALMHRNASYVFIRAEADLDPSEGPIGGQGIGLTPLRSIAIDRSIYSYGVPFFITAELPWQGPNKTPFGRLVIAQDTGSAILGPARADIFFGTGDDAGARAGDIRHAGDLIVLLPKEEGPGL
jgi:membrane-bound lytic murein transglycosylase A